jgi:hypothetical protein
VPVFDPGRGRTKTGRLWSYARDDRPWQGPLPPAVAYVSSENLIAGRLLPAQFQPIERRFAGKQRKIGPSCFELAAQHRHHRVVPQLLVVDQMLIAQRNPEHPLTHQSRHLVHDKSAAR